MTLTPPSDRLTTAYTLLSSAVPVLVLVQAVLAGRAMFGTWSITVHGVVGNVTFAVAVGALAAALAVHATRRTVAVAAALAFVLTAQIGLGYAGRDSGEAAAWHIPLGVLAFGLAVHQATVTRGARA